MPGHETGTRRLQLAKRKVVPTTQIPIRTRSHIGVNVVHCRIIPGVVKSDFLKTSNYEVLRGAPHHEREGYADVSRSFG
jgi:hypothetical protein